jgi:RimJ/RimL family protein N-acetyltransferase
MFINRPQGHKTDKMKKDMNVLETERLILRPWKDSDAASLFKYASNPNVGPIAGWQVHTSVENSLDIIRSVLSAPENYAVVLRESGEAIGSIGLMTAKSEVHSAAMGENEGEIGYWIGEPYWGQGLIPEAVRVLLRHCFVDIGLSAVWCGYYDGNEKSKRAQEKCGFRYHHTEHDKPCTLMGDIRTEHFTRLCREEWEEMNEI